MNILDHEQVWRTKSQEGWLAYYWQTGEINWDLYIRPENQTRISGSGVDLAASRLMFISSAGGYLRKSQQPFDAGHPLGDYAIRVFPPDTPFSDIAIAHQHYDHRFVDADPQVLLPLGHLEEFVDKGQIGALSAVISFMGYQPDVSLLLDETIPAIIKIARDESVDAALLVPA